MIKIICAYLEFFLIAAVMTAYAAPLRVKVEDAPASMLFILVGLFALFAASMVRLALATDWQRN